MTKLAIVILTKNEARHITECVKSVVGWCDALIVWDSGSDDGTQQLAYLAGASVIERRFDNYAAQRQAVLDTIDAEWVLFIDADERVTPELRQEILATLVQPEHDGYWLARRNFIVCHEMRAGGFTPDYQLRLLRRAAAHYVAEREVHEIVEIAGSQGKLAAPLLHYNYETWSQFHRKQKVYAAYEAQILAARGIRPRPHNFVLQPLREFHRRFITLAGWRDGVHGLRLAVLLAWYYGFVPYWVLLKY